MKTYLDIFYESSGLDIADIMEISYEQSELDGMDDEDEKWLNDYEGDWNTISLHSQSKFWRR